METLGIKCRPGEKRTGRHKLGEIRDGSEVSLPVMIASGASDGPVLTVTGSLHGDEPNGLAVIGRLFSELDPEQMSGTLIALPIANPFAYISKYRISSLDYDRLNLNRVFPGDVTGLITERVAAAIFDGAIRRSDFYIDCHDGGYDFIARYLIAPQPTQDKAMAAENVSLVRAFAGGLPVNLLKMTPLISRTYGQLGVSVWQAANEIGVAAMCCELGGAGRVWPEFVALGVEGIKNVMRSKGMLTGPAKDAPDQIFATDSAWPRPDRGGWWEQSVALGDIVEANQVVGVVRNAFGEIIETLHAPFRSIVFDIRNTASIMTGEWTVHCGRIIDPPA